MLRFRPPFLTERFFFLTVKLLPEHPHLNERDFAVFARSLDTVRSRQPFRLTASVFLPGLVRLWGKPSFFRLIGLTISAVTKSVKLTSTNALGSRRRESGEFWHGHFFDPAPLPMNIFVAVRRRGLRTHLNPARRGLVEYAEEWRWSSAAGYCKSRRTGKGGVVVLIDRVQLPAETRPRI